MAAKSVGDFELSPETKIYLRSLFEEKDADKSGTINSDELDECLRAVGFCPTEEDLDFLKSNFDKNRDGKLQINELMDNLHIVNAHTLNREELMTAFKKFDINGDGFIRLPELLKVLTTKNGFSVQEARELMNHLLKEHDKNHDGKFDYPEFVDIFLSLDQPFHAKNPAENTVDT